MSCSAENLAKLKVIFTSFKLQRAKDSHAAIKSIPPYGAVLPNVLFPVNAAR
jgi:hypothetical protein